MKIVAPLVVASLVFAASSCTSTNPRTACSFDGQLRSDSCKHDHALEVLDLYLDKDGDLHNGSYKQSDNDLKHQFHLWHQFGGDPLVIVYLYPSLPSNNDWHNICTAIKKIEAYGEHWKLEIQSEGKVAPNTLLSPILSPDTNRKYCGACGPRPNNHKEGIAE